MIETTARRDRRTAPAHDRLDLLISQADTASTNPQPPADGQRPEPPAVPTSVVPHRWPPQTAATRHRRAAPTEPATEPPAEPATERAAGPATQRTTDQAAELVTEPATGLATEPDDERRVEADRPATVQLPDVGALLPSPQPWWRRRLRRLLEHWLPDRAADPPRWRLAGLAAGAVLLGVSVAVGLTLTGSGGEVEVPPALPAAAVSEVRDPTTGSAPGASPSLVISVVGRVVTPGLVTVPEGARVADALKAAGGPAPGVDLAELNLARRLSDGEQIYVGVRPPPHAEPPGGTGAARPDAERVDLNTASLAALDTLPGVGPVTAQRILDWRTRHGRFASVDQLREVEGIGPSRFARLKDRVVAW